MERGSRADDDLRDVLLRRHAAGNGNEKYSFVRREGAAGVQVRWSLEEKGGERGSRGFNRSGRKERKCRSGVQTRPFFSNPLFVSPFCRRFVGCACAPLLDHHEGHEESEVSELYIC